MFVPVIYSLVKASGNFGDVFREYVKFRRKAKFGLCKSEARQGTKCRRVGRSGGILHCLSKYFRSSPISSKREEKEGRKRGICIGWDTLRNFRVQGPDKGCCRRREYCPTVDLTPYFSCWFTSVLAHLSWRREGGKTEDSKTLSSQLIILQWRFDFFFKLLRIF